MRGNAWSFVFGVVFLLLVAVYVGMTTFRTVPEVTVEVSPEPPSNVPVEVPVIPEPEPSCFPPYIESGDACCIDEDDDKVCDEVKIPLTVIVNCKDCNDNNQCTQDVCFGDECRNYCMLNSKCDDGNPYTSHDTCVSVATGDCSCRGDPVGCVTNADCNDLNPCSEDRCVDNICHNICRVGIACDDSKPETTDDKCMIKLGKCACAGKEKIIRK